MRQETAIKEFNSKHSNFFKGASVTNYIENLGTEWVFKPGLILDSEIWEDMRITFKIKEIPCVTTYLL